MRIEIPELKKCCFCVPLRLGLLFWIYLKLAVGLILVSYFIKSFINIISNHSDIMSYIIVTVALIVVIMEIAFSALFLISAHRKNHEQMRIYYRYAICMLIVEVVAMIGFVGLDVYITVINLPFSLFVLQYMFEYNCFIFVQIVLQTYLVILVRSEVLKLEGAAKFEFINHASEPECKAQIIP